MPVSFFSQLRFRNLESEEPHLRVLIPLLSLLTPPPPPSPLLYPGWIYILIVSITNSKYIFSTVTTIDDNVDLNSLLPFTDTDAVGQLDLLSSQPLHKYSVFHKQIRRSFPFLTLLHLQNGYRSTDLSYSHKYFILIFILVSKSYLTHKCSRGQANILFLKDKLTYECTNIIYKPNIQARCYVYSLFITLLFYIDVLNNRFITSPLKITICQ